MRWIIWLLLIFAAAIGVAFLTADITNEAQVSFFMAENRYDLAFNYFVILAVLAVVAFYLLLRLLIRTIQLPKQTRRWNLLRGERYSHNKFNQAVLQYFSGRYAQSLKNTHRALLFHQKKGHLLGKESGSREFATIALLLTAANEQKLGNPEAAQAKIKEAIQLSKKSHIGEAPDGLQLLQIEWLIGQGQLEAAKNALTELDPRAMRQPSSLQLQLTVDRLANDPQAAMQTVKQLTKRKGLDEAEANAVIVESVCKVLEVANTPEELKSAWGNLHKKDRNRPEIIIYAAKHYSILGDTASTLGLIAQSWHQLTGLSPELKTEYLLTLDRVIADSGRDWLDRLEKAHNEHPDDALLTYLTARACEVHGVLGRSQTLFEQAARHPDLPILMRQKAWFSIAQYAEANGELTQANACYKKAVGLLPN